VGQAGPAEARGRRPGHKEQVLTVSNQLYTFRNGEHMENTEKSGTKMVHPGPLNLKAMRNTEYDSPVQRSELQRNTSYKPILSCALLQEFQQ
jgi:hypothetical protein